MLVKNKHYRSIWRVGSSFPSPVDNLTDGGVYIIDQRWLPHEFEIVKLSTVQDVFVAIHEMQVRGAPLIGATAAYGACIAAREYKKEVDFIKACEYLLSARPTAVNLEWALRRQMEVYKQTGGSVEAMVELADRICDEDAAANEKIGDFGLEVIRKIAEERDLNRPINILTHCNAGWLATVDWGTATAPIYKAEKAGIDVHVWVDETRPRNQGARLTAWELQQQGIQHTLIVDNVGGHLMQQGMVDLMITGTDRTTYTGDVCNKVGTYLKALAAHDNGIPFYVALPGPTIDWNMSDGVREIPIEERHPAEVSHMMGKGEDGKVNRFQLCPDKTPIANYSFDVTPSRLVTGLITERGVCPASAEGLQGLYPEMHAQQTAE